MFGISGKFAKKKRKAGIDFGNIESNYHLGAAMG